MNSKRNMLAYDRSSTGLWVALIFRVYKVKGGFAWELTEGMTVLL